MIAQEELKTHRAEFLNLRVFPEGEAPSRGGLSSYLAVEAMYIEKVCDVLRLINGEASEQLDSFRNVDDSPVAMCLLQTRNGRKCKRKSPEMQGRNPRDCKGPLKA